MSALTERIGHYHKVYSIESTDTEFPGIECRCIDAPERMWWSAYAAHVAEVTEQAVRASVADEIRALDDGEPRSPDALNAIDDAARIAEGKQP